MPGKKTHCSIVVQVLVLTRAPAAGEHDVATQVNNPKLTSSDESQFCLYLLAETT